MKRSKRHGSVMNQRGFTLIEVLIAATTFLVGFSLMVAVLNQTVTKLSVVELETAREIANNEMMRSLAIGDTASTSVMVNRQDLSYRVSKVTTSELPLVSIHIIVSREKSGKELVSLYSAFVVSPE